MIRGAGNSGRASALGRPPGRSDSWSQRASSAVICCLAKSLGTNENHYKTEIAKIKKNLECKISHVKPETFETESF